MEKDKLIIRYSKYLRWCGSDNNWGSGKVTLLFKRKKTIKATIRTLFGYKRDIRIDLPEGTQINCIENNIPFINNITISLEQKRGLIKNEK